ncbi:MAG: hypothetical protein ACE5FJ_01945 [Gemmatimonadales bacterium]
MVHEMVTALSAAEVLDRAKAFFTERVPHYGAYLEKEGESFVTFRGQGGEEIALAVYGDAEAITVRGSTLLYDQAIGRFFSTLPRAESGSDE